MDYVGRIFRPPSEAQSLLIQVTVGCSHNRCTYCDMYRDKRFRTKPMAQIAADIEEARRAGPRVERVFLCDGDALIVSQPKLLEILGLISKRLPWVTRVSTYGDARSVLKKSVEQLRALRGAGLGIIYHGVETGDDEVMAQIDKGATRAEVLETGHRLTEAGLTHSVIVLLGIGGVARSEAHARETASLLTQLDPAYVGALTTTVLPGTPLHAAQVRGEFELPGTWALLEELRTLVSDARFSRCRFSSNHASNYLPLRGTFPRDQPAMLALLDRVLEERDPRLLKPEHFRGL